MRFVGAPFCVQETFVHQKRLRIATEQQLTVTTQEIDTSNESESTQRLGSIISTMKQEGKRGVS